jgi:hypothetical protein
MKTQNRMKKLLPLLLSLLSSAAFAANEIPAEIHLWPNGAPGFESRANEKETVTIRVEPDISFPSSPTSRTRPSRHFCRQRGRRPPPPSSSRRAARIAF